MLADGSNTLVIGEGKRVTLHFTVALDSGDVIDSTREKNPATFEVGDGNLLPGFEQSLFGLKRGDRRSILIAAGDGFGEYREENLQRVPRDRFDDELTLEPGLMVFFQDAAGGEMPGVVKAFDEKKVEVDFNHPLAGHDIHFDVEIINVEDTDAPVVKLS